MNCSAKFGYFNRGEPSALHLLGMSASTQASFFWVKYGFDNITPPKMYNANVSCAVLRSFVKNTSARDVEDLCKQKNIQLGIELDALNRALQAAHARSAATSFETSKSGSRPQSGASSSRPITPTMHSSSNGSGDDEITEIVAKKTAIEYQLEVVATASKLAKELIAGTVIVDLANEQGTRLKLDENGDARANTILKSRAQYTAVAVTVDDKGARHAVPLVFSLQKPSTNAPPSRPSSGAAKSTAASVPT